MAKKEFTMWNLTDKKKLKLWDLKKQRGSITNELIGLGFVQTITILVQLFFIGVLLYNFGVYFHIIFVEGLIVLETILSLIGFSLLIIFISYSYINNYDVVENKSKVLSKKLKDVRYSIKKLEGK